MAKIHVDGGAATGPTRSPAPEQSPAGSVPPDDGFGLYDKDGGGRSRNLPAMDPIGRKAVGADA
jgi:hypothetical protein